MADLLHPTGSVEEDRPETPADPGDFEVAITAEDAMQAGLLVDACDEAGIPAILQSPRSSSAGMLDSPVESFQILVPKKDLARARPILEQRRAALEADPQGAERAAEEEEAAGEKG